MVQAKPVISGGKPVIPGASSPPAAVTPVVIMHTRAPRWFSVLKIMHTQLWMNESGVCLPFKHSQPCHHPSLGTLFEGDVGLWGVRMLWA